jgi:hypothetical protein
VKLSELPTLQEVVDGQREDPERSHRIDGEEFYRMLQGIVIDDVPVFNDKLQEWQHYLQLRSPSRRPRRPDPYDRLRRCGLGPRGATAVP